MKAHSLLIFNEKFALTKKYHNLDEIPFLYRSVAISRLETLVSHIIKTIDLNKYYNITEKAEDMNMSIYCYRDKNYYVLISNNEYPERIAIELLSKIKTLDYNELEIEKLWKQYQNPKETDKLLQIQTELDNTKVVLLDSVKKLVERGESIESLQKRAEDLAKEAENFKIDSIKLNRCCKLF